MKKDQENGDLRHGGSGQAEQAFRLALRKLNIDKFFNGKRYYFMNINVKYFPSFFFPAKYILQIKFPLFYFFYYIFVSSPNIFIVYLFLVYFFFLSLLVSFSRFRVSVGFTGCFNQLAWLGCVVGAFKITENRTKKKLKRQKMDNPKM